MYKQAVCGVKLEQHPGSRLLPGGVSTSSVLTPKQHIYISTNHINLQRTGMVCPCGVTVRCQDHFKMMVMLVGVWRRRVLHRGSWRPGATAVWFETCQPGAACNTFVVTPAPGTGGRGVLMGANRGCGWGCVRGLGLKRDRRILFGPASGGRTLSYIFCCSQG